MEASGPRSRCSGAIPISASSLASLISLGGDRFLLVSLFGLTLEITGSAVSVAVLIASQEIPFFLMSPIGGVLTDRLNRRWLMVLCDAARAFLCLGFLFANDAGTIWIAYPLLAVTSSFAAVFDPASSAALPNLVEPQDLGPANALSGSLWGTMLAVGAGLGGLVAAALGRDAAFLIDAASFALSGLLIARNPGSSSFPHPRAPGPTRSPRRASPPAGSAGSAGSATSMPATAAPVVDRTSPRGRCPRN